MSEQVKFLLGENDIPRRWYNITADSPIPPTPVLNPQTKELITPEFLGQTVPEAG